MRYMMFVVLSCLHFAFFDLLSPAPARRSGGYRNAWRQCICQSVRPRYIVSALRFLFVDQFISNLHTSIILGISSLSSKLGKCDLKMATIMAAMAAIFNMVAKTQFFFRSASMLQLQRKLIFRFFLEECDRDQCDFKMKVILAAIFKMATKMRKISKCSNFNEN